MTQLVLFSKSIHNLRKVYTEQQIIQSIIHDRDLFIDFADIHSLLSLWSEIDYSDSTDSLMKIAKDFIRWEHG